MKEIFNKKMILLGLLIGITIGFISVLAGVYKIAKAGFVKTFVCKGLRGFRGDDLTLAKTAKIEQVVKFLLRLI